MKTRSHFRQKGVGALLTLGAGMLLCVLLISSCQPITPPPPEPTPSPAAAQASSSEQSAIQRAWKSSRHADTFVLEEGTNNECARCHSPRDWMPTSAAEMPATCASCKFNVSAPKPVSKADWKSIECAMCHRVENGVSSAQIVWLNTLVEQYDTTKDPYEAVKTPTELCEKCHRDASAARYKRDLGRGPHSSFECTKCHDAHSTQASCAEPCHADALKAKAVAGHDAAHAVVHCVACHDASGLKVGPVEGTKTWLTFRTTDSRGKAAVTPYVSHIVQRQVNCARCHFSDNPWRLKTVTNP